MGALKAMVAAIGVGGMAVAVVAARAPSDAIDAPTHVDVTSSGGVLLGFQTDVADRGSVRRLSPDGAVVAAWTVTGTVGGVAWDRASGVLVNAPEVDRVETFDLDGGPTGGWTLDGLLPDLAVGVTGRSLLPSTYLLAEGAERTEVVRVSAAGARMASWPVIGTPYELAWSPTGGAEGTVQVAVVDLSTPAGAIIVTYATDGTELVDWSVDGDVRGLDVDARGRTHVGVVPERSLYGSVAWYEDGDRVAGCDLPGYPIDVAADPMAGSWVIVLVREGAGPAQLGNDHNLLHVLEDCTIAAVWSNEQLVGEVVTPTPSRTQGTPGPTSTSPAGTDEPTSTAPTPTTGTDEPTGTAPTPQQPPASSVYLPALMRQPR